MWTHLIDNDGKIHSANPKFQAFSLFQRLYKPVCVGPVRNSEDETKLDMRGTETLTDLDVENLGIDKQSMARFRRAQRQSSLRKLNAEKLCHLLCC